MGTGSGPVGIGAAEDDGTTGLVPTVGNAGGTACTRAEVVPAGVGMAIGAAPLLCRGMAVWDTAGITGFAVLEVTDGTGLGTAGEMVGAAGTG